MRPNHHLHHILGFDLDSSLRLVKKSIDTAIVCNIYSPASPRETGQSNMADIQQPPQEATQVAKLPPRSVIYCGGKASLFCRLKCLQLIHYSMQSTTRSTLLQLKLIVCTNELSLTSLAVLRIRRHDEQMRRLAESQTPGSTRAILL